MEIKARMDYLALSKFYSSYKIMLRNLDGNMSKNSLSKLENIARNAAKYIQVPIRCKGEHDVSLTCLQKILRSTQEHLHKEGVLKSTGFTSKGEYDYADLNNLKDLKSAFRKILSSETEDVFFHYMILNALIYVEKHKVNVSYALVLLSGEAVKEFEDELSLLFLQNKGIIKKLKIEYIDGTITEYYEEKK